MRKWMGMLIGAIAALMLMLAISCTPAEETIVSSYADDRSAIEDLQARYMFALDFGDADAYVATFTEDGVLDIIGQQWEGRENIRQIFESMPSEAPEEGEESAAEEDQGPYPATGRHNITNIVIKVDGDTAVGRAYWFHYGNTNPERTAQLDSYGYYEDDMVKVDGEWLFSKRIIYNEQMAEWIGSDENPAW